MKARFLYFLTIVGVSTSCYNDKEAVLYPDTKCDPIVTSTYQGTVAPLMSQYCNACHSGSFPSAGILLDSHAELKKYVDNGRLMGSINWSSGYSAMPKNGNKLTSCNINKIQAWISAGALNN